MKILNVVGARPNFMKMAPIVTEMKKYPLLQPLLVHTGQHYDSQMSRVFFEDLELPEPDIYLGVGSGNHAEQTAKIMIEFEKICMSSRADLVLLVGDVNSTLACSIVAAKLNIPIAHVEAGLRSFDRTMPEEINRIVTDCLSDLLFTTCEDGNINLKNEGVPEDKIHFVGNVMIDTLLKFKNKIKNQPGLIPKDYVLLTLHRPGNVDNKNVLQNILEALWELSGKIPIIFIAHPRAQKQINCFGYEKYFNYLNSGEIGFSGITNAINLSTPLPYPKFLNLMANAKLVLTDSGGIQEETTILNIPCLTLRNNTERPITITEGTNTLVGTDPLKIKMESLRILNGLNKSGNAPKFWDGQAAERIVSILLKKLKPSETKLAVSK